MLLINQGKKERFSLECREVIGLISTKLPPGVGGTPKSFTRRGSAPRSNPLPFYIPFFSEQAPLSYTFYWKKAPLSYTFLIQGSF